MAKLFYKDKPLIGLDISQTGVKVMAVDLKKWSVLGYGSLDVDPSRMQSALDGEDNTYLIENLISLVNTKVIGTLPSNHVAIGLPTARTFSRTFSLPKDQESNLADAVDIEVNQYIPIPSSSLYVDYDIIDRTKDEINVIMSAVPKNLIDGCLNAAETAGLRPVFIEPSINAVARVLGIVEGSNQLPTLIIDIGTASTDIAILVGGVIQVTGGVAVGGNNFTIAISEALGIDLEAAHQLKVTNGLSSNSRQENIEKALNPHLQRIITELHKVVRYYNERITEEKRIEQVIIVGGGSDVPAIGDYFTDKLVMPARVASPWQSLDFGKLPKPAKQFRPRYISVAGLGSIPKGDVIK